MKPNYVIKYYHFQIDEVDKWVAEVKKKVWYGYKTFKKIVQNEQDIESLSLKELLLEFGWDSQEGARKWAMDAIQIEASELCLINEIEEGVWL